MDAIPVFSQIKSFAQWVSGNSKGARETQNNFSKQCPVVSQCTSAVQAICGNAKGARETQMQFLKGVSGMVDSMPGVGHVKGAIHYACGDKEGGDNAMKAASHTVGVIGGGIGGFIVAGPPGAVIAGIAGGALVDSAITSAELVINGHEASPYGIVDNIVQIIDNPKDGGNYVDLIGGMVLDGASGYTAGQGLGKNVKRLCEKRKLAKVLGKDKAKTIVDAGEAMRKDRSVHPTRGRKPHIITIAEDNVTGKNFKGCNKQMRDVLDYHNYPTDGQTELQQRVPDAKPPLNRRVDTCAEQQAYNGLYQDRPNALPGEVNSVSIRWDHNKQTPSTVPGCDNCRQFSPAMGNVPTDLIPETPVPMRVRYGEAAKSTVAACCVCGACTEDGSEEQ